MTGAGALAAAAVAGVLTAGSLPIAVPPPPPLPAAPAPTTTAPAPSATAGAAPVRLTRDALLQPLDVTVFTPAAFTDGAAQGLMTVDDESGEPVVPGVCGDGALDVAPTSSAWSGRWTGERPEDGGARPELAETVRQWDDPGRAGAAFQELDGRVAACTSSTGPLRRLEAPDLGSSESRVLVAGGTEEPGRQRVVLVVQQGDVLVQLDATLGAEDPGAAAQQLAATARTALDRAGR